VRLADQSYRIQDSSSNHTYGLSLKAQVRNKNFALGQRTAEEFQTDPTRAVFRGLGRVSADGQPVDYDSYDFSAGDKSCAVGEGGGAKMVALIHDYPIGSAEALDFKDQNGNSFTTDADSEFDLTQASFSFVPFFFL
jgi:hypothetical protein